MPDSDELFAEGPSKSAVKREMTARQQLGETLAEFNDEQLHRLGVEDAALLEAIAELRRIRSNSARRRHKQYIGKLMRGIDIAAIEAKLAAIKNDQRRRNDSFHLLEQWRDDLLDKGDAAISSVVEQLPTADRQHLRQLIRQHQRELKAGKAPAASRKLFRYLRELQDSESGEA